MRRKEKRRFGLAGGHQDTTFIPSVARTKTEDGKPSRLIMAYEMETTDRKGDDDMGSKAMEALLAAAKAGKSGETTSRRTPAKAAPYAFAPEREQYAQSDAGQKAYDRDLSTFEYKVRDGKVRDAADLPHAPERKSYSSPSEYEHDLADWQDTVGAELLGQHYGAVDDAKQERADKREAINGYQSDDRETKVREEQYLLILQHEAANGDIQAAYKLRELTARRTLAVR